jgi:hypothetical protein
MTPEFHPEKVPPHYLRVALVCLDQREEYYHFVVLFNEALLECPKNELDSLIDCLEKFCAKLRGPSEVKTQ